MSIMVNATEFFGELVVNDPFWKKTHQNRVQRARNMVRQFNESKKLTLTEEHKEVFYIVSTKIELEDYLFPRRNKKPLLWKNEIGAHKAKAVFKADEQKFISLRNSYPNKRIYIFSDKFWKRVEQIEGLSPDAVDFLKKRHHTPKHWHIKLFEGPDSGFDHPDFYEYDGAFE